MLSQKCYVCSNHKIAIELAGKQSVFSNPSLESTWHSVQNECLRTFILTRLAAAMIYKMYNWVLYGSIIVCEIYVQHETDVLPGHFQQ